MAILLPALNKARQLTKRTVCQSNLKQIALGWSMYLDDHDGKFYQGVNFNLFYGGWKGIHFPTEKRPLNSYLNLADLPESESQAKVFHCPEDRASTGVFSPFSDIGTSYQTNHLLIGQTRIAPFPSTALTDAINARLKDQNLNKVYRPSDLLLIGDFPWITQWLPLPSYPFGIPWHGRHCHYNMAFLDGHTGFLKIRKGVFVAEKYNVLPFKQLYGLALQEQVEEPCPICD
jgi:hypothetical protein